MLIQNSKLKLQNSPFKHFSAARVLADIRTIVSHTRWMTSPEIDKAAHYISDRLKATPGLHDVEVVNLPADGKTSFGGWIAPRCWNVRSATLSGGGRTFADYRRNPFGLMMWSPPTPKAGIEAPVAVVAEPFKNGAALRGKFALVGELPQVGIQVLRWLAESGAAGLITDHVITKKGVKEGAYLDDAVQYWNYTNPQWEGEARLPAFGLTPATGRALRAMLAKNPSLRLTARVDSELYAGTMPLVTARLPGKSNLEFVLTAHMDEPGASDNASGTALAMEVLRCMAAHAAANGRPPQHGVRFVASVEARGLNAFLNTRRFGRQSIAAGLNLDMVGYDHKTGRTQLDIISARPATPSALEAVLKDLAAKESRRTRAFKWNFARAVVIDDCHFAGAPYNAPMVCLEQAPDRTYHCSLDTPGNLSAAHLKRMGRLVTGCVDFFTSVDEKRVRAIGAFLRDESAREIRAAKRPAAFVVQDAVRVWAELSRLLPEGVITPDAGTVARLRSSGRLHKGYLAPRYAFEEQAAGWKAELQKLAAKRPGPAPIQHPPVAPALKREAERLVPQKTFAGYLAFEDLNARQRRELFKATGIETGWAASGTVQWALDLCNGKRSLLEIHAAMSRERKVDLRFLLRLVRFLEKSGKIRMRPVLTKKEVLAAIRRVGIRAGDIVMTHSSLSDFGYLQGGARVVIDCLLEAVGETGTVCVPTHSLNWVGRAPYDPKTSPSFTGAIPQEFLKHPRAIRSLHPTHSVAAIGPRAHELLEGHDETVAPQDRRGFWGKFTAAGGRVLMLCKLDSNTLLHGGELWAGTPYPSCEVHVLKQGKRVELTCHGMPWHTHAFDDAHALLRKRRQLRSTTLGESTIHSMDAQPAIAAMMEVIRANPLIAIREKCTCNYCNHLRKHLGVKPLPASNGNGASHRNGGSQAPAARSRRRISVGVKN